MKSPFPGMDPYLEARWGGVHVTLLVYASRQLNSLLPDELCARIEEETQAGVEHEVQVPIEEGVAQPIVVALEDDPRTLRHLEIVDTSDGGRLVTAIELLSPANKVGSTGQLIYIRKQREYLDAGVNLVEIDLIRSGNYVLALPEDRLPPACRTAYLACIRRATRRNEAELYPISLRQALPNLPIPLRPTDQDVVLRLQPLLDDAYRDGGHHRLDYRPDPVPRLGEADARWADAILKEKGLR